MSRLGILGGTFDPVHIGHLIMADSVLNELSLEKVIFIPNGSPPHKSRYITDEKHRYNMLVEAVSDNSCFEVLDLELGQATPSYTVDTLKKLKVIYPNDEIFFIIGADGVINLKSWHKYDELLKLCNFAVVPRVVTVAGVDGAVFYSAEKLSLLIKENLTVEPGKFLFVETPVIPISSSLIRQRISENKSVRYLLPSNVTDYINKLGLYNSP